MRQAPEPAAHRTAVSWLVTVALHALIVALFWGALPRLAPSPPASRVEVVLLPQSAPAPLAVRRLPPGPTPSLSATVAQITPLQPIDAAAPELTPIAAPPLDLDMARQRAVREAIRDPAASTAPAAAGTPGQQREVEMHIATQMQRAARTACLTAYGEQLGLLAPLAVAFDTLRDKGCRW